MVAKEIEENLRSFNRDGNEYSYLCEIDKLAEKWQNIYTDALGKLEEISGQLGLRNSNYDKFMLHRFMELEHTFSQYKEELRMHGEEYNVIPLPEDISEIAQLALFLLRVKLDGVTHKFLLIKKQVAHSHLGIQYPEKFPNLFEPTNQTALDDHGSHSMAQDIKLTWNCKPAVAGYIISELIRAGYLEPPVTNGELSLNKLAGICSHLFEVKGHNPSSGSWRNVIDPERNTLPDFKRVKLNFPDIDQL